MGHVGDIAIAADHSHGVTQYKKQQDIEFARQLNFSVDKKEKTHQNWNIAAPVKEGECSDNGANSARSSQKLNAVWEKWDLQDIWDHPSENKEKQKTNRSNSLL